MKSKPLIIAGLLTLGAVPVVLWAYRKIRCIDAGSVSMAHVAAVEYTLGKVPSE